MTLPPRTPVRLLLGTVLVLITAGPAQAEWQFTPFVGYTFKGATSLVDIEEAAGTRHWNLGGTVTVIGDLPLGLEAHVVYTPGFFQREGTGMVGALDVISSRTYAFMGNAVIAMPRQWNRYGLRPFASGGLGLLHAAAQDQLNILPVRINLLGMNAGGGAVGFVTDRVGLRFDLRYFRSVQGPDVESLDPPISSGLPVRLRYWTASIGVVFRH